MIVSKTIILRPCYYNNIILGMYDITVSTIRPKKLILNVCGNEMRLYYRS